MNKCPKCHALQCEYIGDDYWMCANANCDYEKGSTEYFLESRDAKIEQLEKELAGVNQKYSNLVVNTARDLETIKSLKKELAELKEAKQQLDTLLNCQRIRVLGTSRGGQFGKEGPIKHIGLELWTSFSEIDDSNSRETLMNFLNQTSPELPAVEGGSNE